MRAIQRQCKAKGLILKKEGASKYRIITTINEKVYAWACTSINECKEAIFQATCLKHWMMEAV